MDGSSQEECKTNNQSQDVINFAEFAEFEEALIFLSANMQRTPLKKIETLFQECQKANLAKLTPDGTLAVLLKTSIARLGWYNVLQSYRATDDPDCVFLKFLMQDNYNTRDRYGNTPLHILSTHKENISALSFILTTLKTKTPDRIKLIINLQNAFGNTALHEACRANQQDIVDCLLQIPSIDIQIKNHFEQTALDVADNLKK